MNTGLFIYLPICVLYLYTRIHVHVCEASCTCMFILILFLETLCRFQISKYFRQMQEPRFTNRCLDVVSAQSSLTAARLVFIAPQGPWGLPCGSPILSVVALTVLVILMGVFPEPLETWLKSLRKPGERKKWKNLKYVKKLKNGNLG